MATINGKEVIEINGLYYYLKDIESNINNFGKSKGYKYKHWNKAGSYAINDANELFTDLKNGDLEYNGSYFIDYTGKDRNNPKNKKNLTKGSSYEGGLYRNAGATILADAIKDASPIDLGSEDDFREIIGQQINRKLGNVSDFQKLDTPTNGGDTYGITNRYNIITNTLNDIKNNLDEYKIQYNIPKNFENDLQKAIDAFADGAIDNNEEYYLNLLFMDTSKGINKDYFKTDFSVPKTEEPEDNEEESNTIKKPITEEDTDSYNNWLNELFNEENYVITGTPLSYTIPATSEKSFNEIIENYSDNDIYNMLYTIITDKSSFKSTCKENNINPTEFAVYLFGIACNRNKLSKKINDNEYYFPKLIDFSKKQVLVCKFNKNNNTLNLIMQNWKDIPDFNKELEKEYNKNHSININDIAHKFFV